MGGTAPEWIQVFPYPTYIGELDGQRFEWVTDEISQQSCVDFFNLRGNDLVIDYEHLSDKDTEAPAAGRILELLAGGPAGLLARAEWTDRARRQIESGEYYYDSPSFYWSRDDNRIYGLRHVALTNNPGSWSRPYLTDHSNADYGIGRVSQGVGGARLSLVCAVANHKERRKGMSSNLLDGLRTTLGKPATVSAKEIRADLISLAELVPDSDETIFAQDAAASPDSGAVTVSQIVFGTSPAPAIAEASQRTQNGSAPDLTPLRVALGVDSSDPRELALAIMNLKASTVPAETARELEERLAVAETRTSEERITLAIARQRTAGKQITPAFEAELIRVAKADVDLALSSLSGLQAISFDLATQSDAPAPTVERLETARQRAGDLEPGTSPAQTASNTAFEQTMTIAREKGISYPEANLVRLATSVAA
jgi:Mu-like prophage I protein